MCQREVRAGRKIKEGREVLRGAAGVDRGAKEGLPQGTCEQGLEGSEGVSHGDIQRRHLPGRGKHKCKGP